MVSGIIVLWHSTIASIPAGWHHCDGTEGTPDMRNQFPICALQDDAGVAKATIAGVLAQSGGSANHSHTLPSGNDIIDSSPAGALEKTTSTSYHYPPCRAMVYMMKL